MMTQHPSNAIQLGARAKKFSGLLVPGMDEIRQHRPILAPLVVAWLLSLASAYSLGGFLVAAMPAEQAQYAGALVWINAVAGPLLQGIKALLFAALAWGLLVLTNADRPLRLIFSVLLYGEAILAAQGVVIALFLRFTSGEAMPTLQDLQAGFGLAALVPATSPALVAAAQNVTLLHAAWFAFLCTGFRRVVGLGRWSAAGLAALFWCILVGLAAARLLVL